MEDVNIVINRNNVVDQIVDYIQERVIRGELKGGDRLPSERSLSETLGVSRIPVREAIRSLRQLGIVETKHGQGTFIREANNSFLTRKLATYMYSNETSIFEVLQFRGILEAECARLAAVNASEEELENIKKYKIKSEEAEASLRTGRYDEFSDMDYNFHKEIVKASHNSLFLNLFEAIHKTLQIHQVWSLSQSDQKYDYIEYHNSLLRRSKRKSPMRPILA